MSDAAEVALAANKIAGNANAICTLAAVDGPTFADLADLLGQFNSLYRLLLSQLVQTDE